ncbi:MAG TPA: hypothetical protein VNM69_01145 [Bacillus sp. (in: firmicutes)]|uniref:hypothetical protein n=1 Tax=Bacillus litorisediminis TaxID=2922713 RepID=UPI001FB02825|nr:hypothetical protein [Bacillus litorisediminis]HWO74503.1 hypothetical protein [Bacillus sp. (in: firmicutes)]
MHRPLVYLFFLIGTIAFPSVASAQSILPSADLEEIDAVSPVSAAAEENSDEGLPIKTEKPLESLHKEAVNGKETIDNIQRELADSVEQTEITLEADKSSVELEMTAGRVKVEVKKSLTLEDDLNPNLSLPIENSDKDGLPTVKDSTVKIEKKNLFSNEVPQQDPLANEAQSEVEIYPIKNAEFIQPDQEASNPLPKQERPMLFFYDHPGVIGLPGGSYGSVTPNHSDMSTGGVIYGLLQDPQRIFEFKQGVLSGKVSFYFDQWLNAPPVQPPETSFFFSAK